MYPVLAILGQVNYLVDFTKIITLVVLGPPYPTKQKYISKRLHD